MGFYSNYKDLGNHVEKLISNPNKINKFSKNGKKRYFDLFNSKKVTGEIIKKTFFLII